MRIPLISGLGQIRDDVLHAGHVDRLVEEIGSMAALGERSGGATTADLTGAKRSEALVRSVASYKQALSPDAHVVFVPDRKGWPFVANTAVADLIDYCSTEAEVSLAELDQRFAFRFPTGQLDVVLTELCRLECLTIQEDRRQRPDGLQLPDTKSVKSMGIWLHVTNSCNLRCDYCFVAHKDSSHMSQQTCDELIDGVCHTVATSNLERIVVKFAGGEPTLRPDLIEYFYHSLKGRLALINAEVETRFSMLSNGTILHNRLIRLLQRGDFGIGISIDGYGPEHHDLHRSFGDKSGSWHRIQDNIETLIESGVRPFILATISLGDSSSLTDLVRWVSDSGLRTRLSVVREDTGNKKDEVKELISDFDRMFLAMEEDRYDIDPRNLFSICELDFFSPRRAFCCGIGTSHLVVSHKGHVARCPMTIEEDQGVLGANLLDSIRATMDYQPDSRRESECFACRWFPVCVGGCPVANERELGDPFSVSPLHDFYEYVIPRFIDYFGRKLLQRIERGGYRSFCIGES